MQKTMIPPTARRQGMATYRRGGETVRVQHWSDGGTDWILRGDDVVPAGDKGVMMKLWGLGDELIEDGFTCTASTIIGMGPDVPNNYFA